MYPAGSPNGSQNGPRWFSGGVFLLGTLEVRKIPCMDNLKITKNMSGLHSKCRGGGVSLAYPRTAKYFYN